MQKKSVEKSEILALISQIQDLDKLITILINSDATNGETKKDYIANCGFLKKAHGDLTRILDASSKFKKEKEEEKSQKSNDNVFKENFDLNLGEEATFNYIKNLLNQGCIDPDAKILANIIKRFRHVFFEFLNTEQRFVERCNKINEETIIKLSEVIKIYLEIDQNHDKELFAEMLDYLRLFSLIKNHLQIDSDEILALTSDPYAAVTFLCSRLMSDEFEKTYKILCILSIKHKFINSLLAKMGSVLPEHKPFTLDLMNLIAEPFQRTARYVLFLKQVTNGDEFNHLQLFYEKHQAVNLDRLIQARGNLEEVAVLMEMKVTEINEEIRKQDDNHSEMEHEKYLKKIHKQRTKRERISNKMAEKPKSIFSIASTLFFSNNSPDKKLLQAAYANDPGLALEALQQGANPNVRETDLSALEWANYTPLIIASRLGHFKFVSFLLLELDPNIYFVDTRAQTHTISQPYNTALHWAVRNNYKAIVELLTRIDPGTTCIVSDEFGNIPLYFGVDNNNFDVVKLLLDINCEAQLNATFFKDKVTDAYRLACTKGNYNIAKYLYIQIATLKHEMPELFKRTINYTYLLMRLESYKSINCRLGSTLLTKLAKATDSEISILIDILSMQSKEISLDEFLNGAHIKINDQGNFYQKWSLVEDEIDRSYKGGSSHQSDDPQFQINGQLIIACLIGTNIIEGQKHTWIQAERYSLELKTAIAHGLTFFEYKLTNRNIGPYGSSKYTEAKPAVSAYSPWSEEFEEQISRLLAVSCEQYLERCVGNNESKEVITYDDEASKAGPSFH